MLNQWWYGTLLVIWLYKQKCYADGLKKGLSHMPWRDMAMSFSPLGSIFGFPLSTTFNQFWKKRKRKKKTENNCMTRRTTLRVSPMTLQSKPPATYICPPPYDLRQPVYFNHDTVIFFLNHTWWKRATHRLS